MKRAFLFFAPALLVLTLLPTARAADNESCDKCVLIEAGEPDFCEQHGKGGVFRVQMTSRKLFDALRGERLDREKVMQCPGCKKASEENGKCEKCNIYIVVPRGYKSPVAHKLAKGREVPSDIALPCEGCKTAWAKDGRCAACNHFFCGRDLFRNEEDQKAASAARAILKSAAESKCEGCAVAMVMDGTCEACKAGYKDGKKI